MESTPVEPDREKPPCFGDAARVCPRNEEGFIEPQRHCLACPYVRPCLQAALQAEGTLRAKPESAAPAESSLGRFLKRWSERKRSATGTDKDTTSA
ncbi:hypothetical protein [Desulfosoma caldarium]|uniref:4Fe-4S Wbl-type domain-containing protein n=1 Tax=Desulfosoma caldarium TaxID=610254 RepID=A0A3N1UI99_9BACT|nr:hypothetical protein [Desulfosoma caldarium]ROQ90994.1 hypothetical protein EDC27_2269 [Desulfosoma caldarium]